MFHCSVVLLSDDNGTIFNEVASQICVNVRVKDKDERKIEEVMRETWGA